MGVLLRGGCRCDAVRFEITEVWDAGYCHCNRCRKATGAPVFAFIHVPRAAFKLLSGELIAEPWERLGQGMICRSCRGGVCFDISSLAWVASWTIALAIRSSVVVSRRTKRLSRMQAFSDEL